MNDADRWTLVPVMFGALLVLWLLASAPTLSFRPRDGHIAKRYAREIRNGITLANQVMRHERTRPRNMHPIGSDEPLPLWEQAYHHTFTQAVRSGKLRPPSGPSPLALQLPHKPEEA